jgi:hypothetical protein
MLSYVGLGMVQVKAMLSYVGLGKVYVVTT